MKQSKFFNVNIKVCSLHVCCLLKSQWKWWIYQASLVEYKVQLAPFAGNTIKKSNWPFRLWDRVIVRISRGLQIAHQILLVVNKDKVGNQRRCWRCRRANFAGKLFDSVLECCKGFPVIKYTYVPCLKVAMLCVFVFCDLIVFMVHWDVFRTLSNI